MILGMLRFLVHINDAGRGRDLVLKKLWNSVVFLPPAPHPQYKCSSLTFSNGLNSMLAEEIAPVLSSCSSKGLVEPFEDSAGILMRVSIHPQVSEGMRRSRKHGSGIREY
jgi:hypothetical protein